MASRLGSALFELTSCKMLPGSCTWVPSVSSLLEVPRSLLKAVLCPNSAQGRMWNQLFCYFWPISMSCAFIDSLRLLWLRSIRPLP